MNKDLWETIDWGDGADDSGDTISHQTIPSYWANTKFSASTAVAAARLSGSSAGSEEHDKASGPSTSTTNDTFPEREQDARKKRNAWFRQQSKLVPLGDEQGEFRGSGRSQCKVSNSRAANDPRHRQRRRQSDYAIEKRRVSERHGHASLEDQPLNRSVTKRFLSSVGLGKNSEPDTVSDDDELDVPFPTNGRRQSCN